MVAPTYVHLVGLGTQSLGDAKNKLSERVCMNMSLGKDFASCSMKYTGYVMPLLHAC